MNQKCARVALRADASATIGLGHVKRCLALAHALHRTGADVCLTTRPLGVDATAIGVGEGIEVMWLPARHGVAPWAEDAADTEHILTTWAPSVVVVDHYSYDAAWHRSVRNALGVPLVAIDDLADRPLDVDLLIDHNLVRDHRAKYSGRVAPRTRILGGPRFALIGPAYANGPRYVFRGGIRTIGIFMGGVDAGDLSTQAWDGCRGAAGFNGKISIATTSANPHLPRLREKLASDSLASLAVDLPDLSGFFAEHDLQIGAGGGATWERCCAGAPALVLVVAENQRGVVEELSGAGVVAALRIGQEPTAEAIGHAIAALMAHPERLVTISARSRQLVDGLGAERVALSMLASSLRVRRAEVADSKLMYAWRNDPATRAVSRAADPIPIDRHVQWLRTVLDDANRLLLIGEIGSRSVGVVRFDRNGTDLEVSIYLDPALQGLGIGGQLLHAAEAFAAEETGAGGRFLATVLGHNPASRRMFEAGGYVFSGERGVKPLGDRHSGQTK